VLIDILWRFTSRYCTIFTYLLLIKWSPADGQTMLIIFFIIISTTVVFRLKYQRRDSFNSVSQRLHLTPGSRGVLWSSGCHRPDDHLRRRPPRRSCVGGRQRWLVTAWSWIGGCMQSAQSTHKTRPRLVPPLWHVTPVAAPVTCMCVVASVAGNTSQMTILSLSKTVNQSIGCAT